MALSSATQVRRLSRALIKKGFDKQIKAFVYIDGKPILQFADGRLAFGTYEELTELIEQATSVEWLEAQCDMEELLADT